MNNTHKNMNGASGKITKPATKKYIIKSRYFKIAWIILAFFALGFLINSNTFESPFVFDDKVRIFENPDIRIEKLTINNLWNAAFGKQSSRSRPIGNISFALNYYFHQYELAGYHIVNIIIHIICGILLWLFLKMTMTLKSERSEIVNGQWLALVAALIWLANPVQTQSVTYIVQRLNSMAALFFLLSFIFYLKGRLTTQKGMRWAWFLAAVLGWLLALGCKQNTAMLPFFIILYEWYFFQDLSIDWLKRNLKYFLLIVIVFSIVSLIYLGFKPLDRIAIIADYANKEFSLAERVMTQLRVVVYYLSLIAWPHPSRLNLDYDFPLSTSLIHPFTTLLSLFGIIGLIVLAIVLAKKQRLISFCIFWFIGNLVIESSIIPIAIIFEHRVYLPSMLVWLVPVILIQRYVKTPWVMVGLSAALLALFAYWTFERNKVWQDNATLWADCAAKSPNKARPYANLGAIQKLQNNIDEAIQNTLKALQLNPNFANAHHNLGIIYSDQGKADEAIVHFRRAIAIKPNFVEAHNDLGAALLDHDNLEEAGAHFLKALRLRPNFAQAYSNLGLVQIKQGKTDEAVKNFQKALQLNPNLANTQFNLGDALLKQGKTEQAIMHFHKALELDPDHAQTHNNLGGQLLSQGQLDQAFEHLNRAISINPELAQAHNNMGIILIQRGDLDAAITHFKNAVRLKPDFHSAVNNLNKALAMRNNRGMQGEDIQNALKNRPNDPELHYQLGNFYLGRREISKAISEFKTAVALQPEFIAAQNNLAMAYAADGQYDQALAAFKILLKLDPDNVSTDYNIAVLYALQNNVPESVRWLKKAIDRGYQNWELIKTDKDLANIRASEGYRQLVEGH